MYRYVKRMIDFIIAFISIVVLFPIFIILILFIKLDSKGPVFFTQKRIGKNKAYFNIVKFRTMRIDSPKDTPTHLLVNPDQYITKMGRFLRKTSLDELPQLWNILVGQMSIIGPRPALWNQFDLIKERDKYGANDIRPGLSGWAQINGRDELPISYKAQLDGEYIKKMSFLFDCKCFFRTFTSILKQEGVIEGGTGKMAEEDLNVAVTMDPSDREDVSE